METFVTELVAHRGRTAATARIALDTLVTVPRYHLEALMHPAQTRRATTLVATTIAVAGFALLAGGYAPAIVVAIVGVVVAFSQRSKLAQALHPTSPSSSRPRFIAAGIAVAVAGLTLIIGLIDLGDEPTWPTNRLLAYNLVFLAAIATAITLAIHGVSARRSTQ
jgi:hypothetical protein